jgi:hypothetical protein
MDCSLFELPQWYKAVTLAEHAAGLRGAQAGAGAACADPGKTALI